MVQAWVTENGLTLHPTKTRIVDATGEGFDFLGYHFRGSKHWPRKKSLQKLKDSLRAVTSRTSGRSLSCIIALVNRRLRGWFEYFKHSVRWTFRPLDGWLRRRLRSILRKRSKRRGIAKGADNHRWPNAFFAKHGLFSLEARPSFGLSILTEVKPSTGEPDAGNPPVRFGGRGAADQCGLPYPYQDCLLGIHLRLFSLFCSKAVGGFELLRPGRSIEAAKRLRHQDRPPEKERGPRRRAGEAKLRKNVSLGERRRAKGVRLGIHVLVFVSARVRTRDELRRAPGDTRLVVGASAVLYGYTRRTGV